MAFGNCECPRAAEIADIPNFECADNIGQVQRIILQRRQNTPSFPTFTGGAAGSAELFASWTPLFAAGDASKVQITPFTENIIIPMVEAINEGGDDNTTIDGAPVVVGGTTPLVTGNFRGLTGDIEEALQAYNCEGEAGNLTAFLINEFGKVIGVTRDGTDFTGIDIASWFVGNRGTEGKNANDKTMLQFSLRFGWSNRLKFVTPLDYDARLDFTNP